MQKVEFVKLNSANVSVNNGLNGERAYDITANVNLNNGNVVSVENGSVKNGEEVVATFSMYSTTLTPSFRGVDAAEMCNILMAINGFIGDVKNEVEVNPISI